MVKVRFTDNNKCGYEDEHDIIFIRRSLLKENEGRIRKVLEHEFNHARIGKNRVYNILYDLKEYLYLILAIFVFYWIFWYFNKSDYASCMNYLKQTGSFIFRNITLPK